MPDIVLKKIMNTLEQEKKPLLVNANNLQIKSYSELRTARQGPITAIPTHVLKRPIYTAHSNDKQYRFQVQLPRWLSDRIWDIHTRYGILGWKVNLRYVTRRHDLRFYRGALRTTTMAEVFHGLSQRGIQLYDQDQNGRNLAQVAIAATASDWTNTNRLV